MLNVLKCDILLLERYMRVKSVILNNFRNYKNLKTTFSDGLNIIYGSNASGKTNLVESIYYAGLGKSPRTTKDKELINWESDFAYIKINIEKKYRSHDIEIHIDNHGKKRIAIDRIPVRKINELIGVLNVVYFSPDELDIVKEGPAERRKFLDISLSQQRKKYFNDLIRYNKILAQRNKLLKDYNDPKVIKETLPIWDAQLADKGAEIIKARYEFCEKLKSIVEAEHNILTNGSEKLVIEYESRIADGDINTIKEQYEKMLHASYDKDIFMRYTTVGAHRDDLSITINGIDLRKYGSQGQKRTVALSLKLAEVNLFISEVGEAPVLILDDVLSELDDDRQNRLLEVVSKAQTFITCTGYDGKCDNMIQISNGDIIQ